jgi:hypothetical protein
MDIHTATEIAFKNGYEKGVTEFCEYLIKQMQERDFRGIKYKQGIYTESDMRLLLVEFLEKAK